MTDIGRAHRDALEGVRRINADPFRVAMESPGKPVIDWELGEIGAAIKAATEVKHQAERALRALLAEQDRRCAVLRATRSIATRDIGFANAVVNPAPSPTKDQARILEVFEAACRKGRGDLLPQIYAVCVQAHVDLTNWRSEYGETLPVCYRRVMGELGDPSTP